MAIAFPRRVRPLIALAAIAAAATIAPTIASAAPHSEPSVTDVQKQLGQLAMKNSQLVEKYNQAKVLVQRRQKAATAAQHAAVQADARYRSAHERFVVVVQAQYESDGLGAAGALLDSNSDSNYLDRLETLKVVSNRMAEVVQEIDKARTEAKSASMKAQQLLAGARAQRDEVAKTRKSVQAQIAKYKDLLARLNAQQRAAYQRQVNPSVSATSNRVANVTPSAASSSAAQRAVKFALAQVGKPYVFGAAGPDAYDCSGLTMAAWQQGGVSLPHSAADQYNYGHHVSRDQLQPGDLIFFYQPIGHVTIYIGNGLMVSAPTEGEPVSVVPLSSFNSDYTGATRLVG